MTKGEPKRTKRNRRIADILITIWNIIGVIIVAGFLLYGLIIGGSASLGYREENTFFVGNHGKYTQVPEIIWLISFVWEFLFWISIPLTPIGAFLISHIQEKKDKRKTDFLA